jgi:CYTH domain-containing protein
LQGLVLCEVGSATEAELAAFRAPPWAPIEVTADPFFAGGTLAFATPAQLRERLAQR